MPIYWFALLVAVLFSASAARESIAVERPILMTFSSVMLCGMIAKTIALLGAKQVLSGQETYYSAYRKLCRQLEFLRWMWLPIGAVGLTTFGLAQTASEAAMANSIALRAAILLIPSMLAIATTWIAQRQFVDWADSQQSNSDGMEAQSTVGFIIDSFRLQCGWIIAPVLLVLAIIDLAELGFGISQYTGEYGAAAVALLSLPLALPMLITMIWPTEKISIDSEDAWLTDLVAAAGFRRIGLRRWNTGGRVCSALVAGLVPGFRVLLLSDSLLDRLDRKGIAMVLLHELAHISRCHMLLRMLALLPAWGIAMAVASLTPNADVENALGSALGIGLTAIALRLVSHATELDADRHACKLAARVGLIDGEVFDEPTAAHTLAVALKTVSLDNPKASNSSWMHPSLNTRLDNLAYAAIPTPAQPTQPALLPLSE